LSVLLARLGIIYGWANVLHHVQQIMGNLLLIISVLRVRMQIVLIAAMMLTTAFVVDYFLLCSMALALITALVGTKMCILKISYQLV
jgi:hypothetical protein